jgi:pimeloyl-ACP methyl ester carboxylesterase
MFPQRDQRSMALYVLTAAFFALSRSDAGAQTPAALCDSIRTRHLSDGEIRARWRDRSPHSVQRIAVDSLVSVEVLDWGGDSAGPVVVWLPGAHSTAHVYDDIAPQLTHLGRQIAITPRGQFPSSIPTSGYLVRDRVRDVQAVLDTLHVRRAVIIGHSMSGDVLTGMATNFPERVRALVYLDAAYDRSSPGPRIPSEFVRLPTADAASLYGTVRAICGQNPSPQPAQITESTYEWADLAPEPDRHRAALASRSRDQEAIRDGAAMWIGAGRIPEPSVPVLMIFARHGARDQPLDLYGIRDDDAVRRRYFDWWSVAMQPRLDRERGAVAKAWPNANIVVIASAAHEVMWSDTLEVLRSIQSVLQGLR